MCSSDLGETITVTGTTATTNDVNTEPIITDELIRQAAHHASCEKWVVFTDLHCSPATLETSLEVLDAVHEAALRINRSGSKCGVLFLGDFWHARGTIRVDCLNAVLRRFRTWTVPFVAIPGNHDQVTLSGLGRDVRDVPFILRAILANYHILDTVAREKATNKWLVLQSYRSGRRSDKQQVGKATEATNGDAQGTAAAVAVVSGGPTAHYASLRVLPRANAPDSARQARGPACSDVCWWLVGAGSDCWLSGGGRARD